MNPIVALLIQYKYLLLFPLVVIEGPVVALVAGFLVFLGHLSFWPTLAILVIGDLTSDAIYYTIGRFGNQQRLVKKYGSGLNSVWQEHPKKMMFFGKFAYGVSVPIIVSAGVAKVPVGKFFLYALPATIFQYGGLLVISHYLGQSYQQAEKYIFYVGIVVVLILIPILIHFWRYAREQVTVELKTNEPTAN